MTYGEVAREVAIFNPQYVLMWTGVDCAVIDLPTFEAICEACGPSNESGCVVTVPREGWVVLIPRKLYRRESTNSKATGVVNTRRRRK